MIAGRHALVTGGGSGVGRAIALALAGAGVAVTICGRREEALTEVASQNNRIVGIAADVTDEAAMTALYEKAEAERGPIDIVVANMHAAIDRQPEFHIYFDDRADWTHVDDGLPRLGGTTGVEPIPETDTRD